MRERERLLPEGLLAHERMDRERGERDRERDRDRMLPFDLQTHRDSKSRAEMKMDRAEYEPLLPREALVDVDKPADNSHLQGEASEPEKMDSLDGKSFFTTFLILLPNKRVMGAEFLI